MYILYLRGPPSASLHGSFGKWGFSFSHLCSGSRPREDRERLCCVGRSAVCAMLVSKSSHHNIKTNSNMDWNPAVWGSILSSLRGLAHWSSQQPFEAGAVITTPPPPPRLTDEEMGRRRRSFRQAHSWWEPRVKCSSLAPWLHFCFGKKEKLSSL